MNEERRRGEEEEEEEEEEKREVQASQGMELWIFGMEL